MRAYRSKPLWFALTMIAAFVGLQALTLDYGTKINDLPFIRDYQVKSNVAGGSSLDRGQLVSGQGTRAETLDLWMVRYKLYSIEADEVVNIMALARMKPSRFEFDPGFYEYGGAYLYPLGAWYFALSKLGAIHIAPLEEMLKDPQIIDRVWIAGRAFVLIAFALSAVLLFLCMVELAPASVALLALAIYLLCPASIMFSQVMKPHWYALLWVNCAMLVIVRAIRRERLTTLSEFFLAACLGMAVGSALTFAVFATLIWGALAYLAARNRIRAAALIRIPIFAVMVFIAVNPYYVLNWHAVQAERVAAASWFAPSLSLGVLAGFVRTSLLSGFGALLIAIATAIGLWRLIKGPLAARLFAIALLAPALFIAALTANHSDWTVNFRYMSYELPALLLFLMAWPWRFRASALTICVIATAAQAAPMKLAYFDENSESHSTRFRAAAWIDENIPHTDTVCLTTAEIVPFEVPPFRFDQYKLNSPSCRWLIRVERSPRVVSAPPNFSIAQRFSPRLSPQMFPLVWEHINPQISIYRKHD